MGGRTLVGKSENAARGEFLFDENLKVKRIFTKGGKHSTGRTRVSPSYREKGEKSVDTWVQRTEGFFCRRRNVALNWSLHVRILYPKIKQNSMTDLEQQANMAVSQI